MTVNDDELDNDSLYLSLSLVLLLAHDMSHVLECFLLCSFFIHGWGDVPAALGRSKTLPFSL